MPTYKKFNEIQFKYEYWLFFHYQLINYIYIIINIYDK